MVRRSQATGEEQVEAARCVHTGEAVRCVHRWSFVTLTIETMGADPCHYCTNCRSSQLYIQVHRILGRQYNPLLIPELEYMVLELVSHITGSPASTSSVHTARSPPLTTCCSYPHVTKHNSACCFYLNKFVKLSWLAECEHFTKL